MVFSDSSSAPMLDELWEGLACALFTDFLVSLSIASHRSVIIQVDRGKFTIDSVFVTRILRLPTQPISCNGVTIVRDLLWTTGCDDLSAVFPPAWAKVDNPVGAADDIEIMLDDH